MSWKVPNHNLGTFLFVYHWTAPSLSLHGLPASVAHNLLSEILAHGCTIGMMQYYNYIPHYLLDYHRVHRLQWLGHYFPV